MADEEKLKEIASQLQHPKGDKGIEIGNSMNESNTGMTLNTIDALNIKKNDIILELGHGYCKHLNHIFNYSDDVLYYGLDISTLMIEESQKANEQYILQKKASFTHFNGNNIPHPDNFFDKGYTVNTIYFWKNPCQMLEEIYRIMKPGGVFNITFGEDTFMKNLPFTKFGFNLYNAEKVNNVICKTSFKTPDFKIINEKIKGKDDNLINRTYVIASVTK